MAEANKLKVGLVGGTFDPPHLGHLLLVETLRWRYEPDAVWLLPVARHPFQKRCSPFEERLALAGIAARLAGPGVEALDTERTLVEAGGDGSSYELLRHLTAARPAARFLFAMGADAWAERAGWREFAALQALAEVVVFNRSGAPPVEGAGPPLPAVSSSEVRRRVAVGGPIGELVPAEIERYIRARGLYR